MIIQNLTPQQAGTVDNFLKELEKSNPGLSWTTFPMGAQPHPIHHVVHPEVTQDTTERLIRIEEKLDTMLTRLDLIFGDHALVDGRFVQIKHMHER